MEKFKIGSRFANKIWNASRFVLSNYENRKEEVKLYSLNEVVKMDIDITDRWIISLYNTTVKKVHNMFEEYRLSDVAIALQEFFWDNFCDWYIEISKVKLNTEEKDTTISVLLGVLSGFLKLIHPIMPFISERIYKELPEKYKDKDYLVISSYPVFDPSLSNEDAENTFEILEEVVYYIRQIRGILNIKPSDEVDVKININLSEYDDKIKKMFSQDIFIGIVKKLAKVNKILEVGKVNKVKGEAGAVGRFVSIMVPVSNLVDVQKEKDRIQKEIAKLESVLKGIDSKLSNSLFIEKAPQEIVEEEKEKKKQFTKMIQEMKDVIENL
ncbi:MAG: class I tRNA ligase family protein [Brevinematia bacterium]